MNNQELPTSSGVFNETSLLERGKLLSQALKASLPPRIDPATISSTARIPFKVLCLREVLLFRISELAEAALRCYEENQLVATATLSRALMESIALSYWLYKEIQGSLERGTSDKINIFLGKALVGRREETPLLLAHNVMNAIDAVTIDIPDYRKLYEHLCEIAHPNWDGCLGAYATLNREEGCYELGLACLPRPLILGPVVTALEFFVSFYDGMIPCLKEFAVLCEKEIEE